MKHALTAACLAAALAVAQAGPLAAETPSTPEPAPAAPPQAVAAPEAKGDPRVERQRNGAAKVAGMIRFVAVECPDAQPDYDRFKKVIAAMGVDIKDLEQGPLMVESLGYSEAYKKDTPGSCKRAFEHFGESGTTIPGLVARKAPGAKTPDAPAPDGKAPDAKVPDAKVPDAKSP